MLVLQFLFANLLPSLLAGGAAWYFVRLAIRALGLRDPRKRLALYGVPLLKSSLVLLAVDTVLPWPPFFEAWRSLAVPWDISIPCALIWSGSALILQDAVRRSVFRQTLSGAEPAPPHVRAQLDEAVRDILRAYRRGAPWRRRLPPGWSAPVRELPESLPVLVSAKTAVPTIVTQKGREVIVLPKGLEALLSGEEMRSVLAHEIAHLVISAPALASPMWWSLLTPLSPIALFLAREVQKEEERACDAMAAALVQDAATYAETLLKSYRFSRTVPNSGVVQPRWAQLTGARPAISERVEEILRSRTAIDAAWVQTTASCLTWAAAWLVLF